MNRFPARHGSLVAAPSSTCLVNLSVVPQFAVPSRLPCYGGCHCVAVLQSTCDQHVLNYLCAKTGGTSRLHKANGVELCKPTAKQVAAGMCVW